MTIIFNNWKKMRLIVFFVQCHLRCKYFQFHCVIRLAVFAASESFVIEFCFGRSCDGSDIFWTSRRPSIVDFNTAWVRSNNLCIIWLSFTRIQTRSWRLSLSLSVVQATCSNALVFKTLEYWFEYWLATRLRDDSKRNLSPYVSRYSWPTILFRHLSG